MYTNNKKITDLLKNKKVLVTAHRGSCGGNLCQNTRLTYKAAWLQGADMIEMDVIQSKDKQYYAYHSFQEEQILHCHKLVSEMSSDEIDQLEIHNWLDQPSGYHLEKMDDILDEFSDKVLINIDRTWEFWEDLVDHLHQREHGSILLKSHVEEHCLQKLHDSKSDIMYMPIVYSKDEFMKVLNYDLNLAAVEIIFQSLDDELVSDEMFELYRSLGIAVFVNAETLGADPSFNLCANLGDNFSIAEGFDKGWGKLADMGFNIIQTDWVGLLVNYLKTR